MARHASVDFNEKGIGPTAEKHMVARGGDRVAPYVIRNHFALSNRLVIKVYSDGVKVAERSVSSQQTVEVTVPGFSDMRRNIRIEYTEAYNRSWIPVVIYEYNSNNIPHGVEPYSMIYSDKQSIDNEFEVHEDYIYVKPSNNNSTEIGGHTSKSSRSIKEQVITYDELYNQFYDNNKQMLVNSAKDYISGDTIFVSDKISSIYYDEYQNSICIRFLSSNTYFDEHEIHFNGDITKEYKIGDIVNLRFKLLTSYKSPSFEYTDIDYNVYIKENCCLFSRKKSHRNVALLFCYFATIYSALSYETPLHMGFVA